MFLEEYNDNLLDFNKKFELEIKIPSLEDRISTDENDLQENLSKINTQIKAKKELCLKLLNNINTNKQNDMKEMFEMLSEKLDIDTNKINSGEDLKKFISENFDLSEKVLKFLFVGEESSGKTWTLNFIKNLYKENGEKEFKCSPTTR